MNTEKADNKRVEPKLWCESCRIRIAANEERTTVDGKTYHPNCYAKLTREESRK